MIIDAHTHNSPEGILSVEPIELAGLAENETGRLYSVGFHPWNIAPSGLTPEDIDLFDRMAEREDVVAIGECGIDLLRGPLLAIQMNAFRRQAETAVRLGKPVIVHCVKGYEQVIGIRKQLKPERPWAIHGFRGKPTVAQMLVNAGFMISIGEHFNSASIAEIPTDRLLIETDESTLPIEEIVVLLSAAKELEPEEMAEILAANLSTFLGWDGVIA